MGLNNIISSLVIFLLGWMFQICTRSDGTFNRRLFSLIDVKAKAPATKLINNVRVSTSDISVDSCRNLWFRIFTPSIKSKLVPLIVYFHGGGFSNFGADTYLFDGLCSRLAAAVPAVVVSVNYRLSPEHKWPSQYEDGFDVLKFIDGNEVLPANADLSKCFVGGDSAGSNIAHHVAIRVVESSEQFHKVRVIGIVGMQPFFGGEERTESEVRLRNAPILSVKQTDAFWRDFLPDGADRNHPAVHVFDDEDMKNLEFPTSLVIVGGNDPLQDWGRRYVEWLKSCGKTVELIEFPNACHAFYIFPDLPDSPSVMDCVADFVNKQLTQS